MHAKYKRKKESVTERNPQETLLTNTTDQHRKCLKWMLHLLKHSDQVNVKYKKRIESVETRQENQLKRRKSTLLLKTCMTYLGN